MKAFTLDELPLYLHQYRSQNGQWKIISVLLACIVKSQLPF
jgi:hypothetical protein